MHVFVAGASGAVGRPLVLKLLAAGHRVTGLVSSPASAARLAQTGADPLAADALDREAVFRAVGACKPDAIVNELTRIPPRINPRTADRDLAPTSRLRREAGTWLAEAAAAAGTRRLISQSIAFAYKPRPGGPWTEGDPLFVDAPAPFSEVVNAVAALERVTMQTRGVEGVVLRYGYFYGPGTVYAADGTFADDVRRRKIPLMGAGSGVFSFIHVDDAAEATLRALDGPAGIYNIVDDAPVAAREWLPEYARMLGARAPMRAPRWLGRLFGGPYAEYLMLDQQGASNATAAERLHWRPAHRSWRDGFSAMLAGERATTA